MKEYKLVELSAKNQYDLIERIKAARRPFAKHKFKWRINKPTKNGEF